MSAHTQPLDAGSLGGRLRRQAAARRPVLVAAGLCLLALVVVRAGTFRAGGSPEASLAAAVEVDGLALDPEGTLWLRPEPSSAGTRPVLFRAADATGTPDLYYAAPRVSAAGDVFSLGVVSNLTRTSGAAEGRLHRAGDFAAYLTLVGDAYDAVTVLDLRGEPPELTADWPGVARAQNRVQNLQETGRPEGFGRTRYGLATPSADARLSVEGELFVVSTPGGRVLLDPSRPEPLEGAELVELRPQNKAQPGRLTWVVDTVRNLSFVGPEPIAWLEHRVFRAKDLLTRGYYGVVGTDSTELQTEAAEDLGISVEETRRRAELSVTDPELGWPPAPLETSVEPETEGEGEWIAVVDDPFVAAYPNAPPAFFQTFLRVDPERPFTRVSIVLWDPRQVQLRVMTGTREPESATGETGPGLVPRDDETLERVVGGFNGGFQSLHGEFGMISEGRRYLPPKPWAATVLVRKDGRTAMGSWLDPPEGVRRYEEGWAWEQVPPDVVELRQNLTSVIEGDRINPWRRWWWGAAPQNDEEQLFIHRSGVCLTGEGFYAYFWGESMSPEGLGEAMRRTRCVRGIHLDMNDRHTAFEFYRLTRSDQPFPSLGRELTAHEFEMPVPAARSWVMRGRKAVRSMTPMRFPRYMRTDPRDFFYLTLIPRLPGPHLAGGGEPGQAGTFSTDGLPHAGWPHAFARTFLGGGEGERTWLVRVDPSRAVPGPLAEEGVHLRALAWLSAASDLARPDAAYALYAEERTVGRRFAVGAPPRRATVILAGAPLAETPDAGAAIGVDHDGFLVYAERQPGDPTSLAERLAQAGIAGAVALPDEVRLSFSVGDVAVAPDAYERPIDPALALPLLAEERPSAEVLYPDVAPRPYMYWGRIQDTRVRYFRDGPVRFRGPQDVPGAESLEEE